MTIEIEMTKEQYERFLLILQLLREENLRRQKHDISEFEEDE